MLAQREERTDLRIVWAGQLSALKKKGLACSFDRLGSLVTRVCTEVKGVDYLLIAKPVVHLNYSGIRHDCAAFILSWPVY